MNFRSSSLVPAALISPRIPPLAAAALLAFPLQTAWAGYDLPALEKIEQQVNAVAEKNMPAVVALTYRSGRGPTHSGSGVIISKDGLIVTAAHVLGEQDAVTVTLTNGKQVRAKVLGMNRGRDLAMVRIDPPGSYPFAELGDSKDLAVGKMVVGMGHTGGFNPQRKPPIRFGRVRSFDHDKFINSDCSLAGGDSGGPLFDLEGKVVGIHSASVFEMGASMDAPVEAVREDWDRLLKGERWGSGPLKPEPSAEEQAGLDMKRFKERVTAEARKTGGKLSLQPESIGQWLKECGMKEEKIQSLDDPAKIDLVKKTINGEGKGKIGTMPQNAPRTPEEESALAEQDKEVRQAMKPALDKLSQSVVSLLDGDKQLALGTIIHANGFVLTKHSEIAKAKGPLKVRLADGREFTGKEVRKFADHDLALVKIAADSLPAVTLSGRSETLEPGDFLFTPGHRSASPILAMGVVSVKDRTLKESRGYLGIGLAQGKEAVEVGEVAPDSPAAKAGLLTKDLILAVNDKPVEETEKMYALIRSMSADTKIQIKYRRGGEDNTTEVTLGQRAMPPGRQAKSNPTSSLGIEVSDQATGFPLIFQHDQPLKPNECGSIIADLHGQVVGVNIARAGLTDAYAIPAGTVADLLKTVDFASLGK